MTKSLTVLLICIIQKDIERKQIHNDKNKIASVILRKEQTIIFKNGYE